MFSQQVFVLLGEKALQSFFLRNNQAAPERWPSGRRRSPAKGVYVKSVSWVRIPSSPPLRHKTGKFQPHRSPVPSHRRSALATVSACRLFFRLFRIDTRDKSAADINGQSSNATSRHQISSRGEPDGWRRIGIVTDTKRAFRIVMRGNRAANGMGFSIVSPCALRRSVRCRRVRKQKFPSSLPGEARFRRKSR